MSASLNDGLPIYEVVGDKQKLQLKLGGVPRRTMLNPVVLLREVEGDLVCVVLYASGQAVAFNILITDKPSLAVIQDFPKASNDAAVHKALSDGLESGWIADGPGAIECDGQMLSVYAGESSYHYLIGRDALPIVMRSKTADDGSLSVHLDLGTQGHCRLRVAPEEVRQSRKALVYLQQPVQPTGRVGRIQWEYKVVKNMMAASLEEQLNQLGGDGWEVVSLAGLDGVFSVTGNKLYAVLKRRKG